MKQQNYTNRNSRLAYSRAVNQKSLRIYLGNYLNINFIVIKSQKSVQLGNSWENKS